MDEETRIIEDTRVEKSDSNSRKWKHVVLSASSGVGASVASASAFRLGLESGESVDNDEVEVQDEVEVEEEVVVVNDDMTFDEAFAVARNEYGAGAEFEWHGNRYNTYTSEEWEELVDGEENPVEVLVEDEVEIEGLDENEMYVVEAFDDYNYDESGNLNDIDVDYDDFIV